jgi:hypothetical protein
MTPLRIARRVVVGVVLALALAAGVEAQEPASTDARVAKLEQEIAELRQLLTKAIAALTELSKQLPQPSPAELAKQSRLAMEKTCKDVGLKFVGVTAQQQPTQTVVVQCAP